MSFQNRCNFHCTASTHPLITTGFLFIISPKICLRVGSVSLKWNKCNYFNQEAATFVCTLHHLWICRITLFLPEKECLSSRQAFFFNFSFFCYNIIWAALTLSDHKKKTKHNCNANRSQFVLSLRVCAPLCMHVWGRDWPSAITFFSEDRSVG